MQEVTLQFDRNADYRIREAYKTLRTNVEFCGGDVRVIAVTSCTPNEGKSSVTMELARSFAEAGSQILLVDADMRKSVLVGRYKTSGVRLGLSHCLVGKYRYEEVACRTNVAGLDMIFSGPVPPNPSELLGSGKFAGILEGARGSYDYIFVDTPPLGSVIDAAVVAKNCDGMMLVVESNAVSYRFVQRVKDQLDKAGSRILGVVLNKVELNGRGYYGHYGRYYGRYYGKYYGRYGEENGEGSSPGDAGGGAEEDGPSKKKAAEGRTAGKAGKTAEDGTAGIIGQEEEAKPDEKTERTRKTKPAGKIRKTEEADPAGKTGKAEENEPAEEDGIEYIEEL